MHRIVYKYEFCMMRINILRSQCKSIFNANTHSLSPILGKSQVLLLLFYISTEKLIPLLLLWLLKSTDFFYLFCFQLLHRSNIVIIIIISHIGGIKRMKLRPRASKQVCANRIKRKTLADSIKLEWNCKTFEKKLKFRDHNGFYYCIYYTHRHIYTCQMYHQPISRCCL